jgi:hypothetical protein
VQIFLGRWRDWGQVNLTILLKNPKNASTRLSMNGKIPNDFQRSPVRSFDKTQGRLRGTRRMNGGFSAESLIDLFDRRSLP